MGRARRKRQGVLKIVPSLVAATRGVELKVGPDRLVFKKRVAAWAFAHTDSNIALVLREFKKVLFEIRRADLEAAHQSDVTVGIMLNKVEHPLVVRNPFARLDDYRGVNSVLVGNLVEMLGQNRLIQHLVRLRRPRHTFRPCRVV